MSTSRLTAEELIRAATGGSYPGDGEGTFFTKDGWVFGGAPFLGVDLLEEATYRNLQDYINLQSAGYISGGVITDSGSGQIDVALGKGMIKLTDSDIGNLVFFDWAAETNVSLTDSITNWIFIDYDVSTEVVSVGVTTDITTVDFHTEIVIGRVYRDGTTLYILNVGQDITDYFRQSCLRDFNVYGFQHASGDALGETGTRNITVSAGVFYCAHNKITTSNVDTSAVGTFSVWYSAASTTPDATGETQIDNANYWNGSAYVNLTSNRYTTKWVYRAHDGTIHVQPGVSNVATIAAAEGEDVPTPPNFISSFCLLVGRIIIREGGTSFISVTSAFDEVFVGTGAVNHNDLANIQGGTAAEYYHLTSAEHVELHAWLDDVTLSDGGAMDIGAGDFTTTGTIEGGAVTQGGIAVLLADGNVGLTADWDVGSHKIIAEQFESDVAIGTAPFIVTSTTVVTNLHAATADQWHTTRTITMSGDVSSDAVNIDGSGNITVTNTVVANDSHTHDTRYYTETELDAALALKAPLASPTFTGAVTIPSTADDATYTGIVTNDTGVLKYRTKAEILTDIAASPLAGSASIVTVGTIASGVWQGTAINATYLDTNVILASELAAWAGSANIVTVGTIGTGTWQGSVIDETYLDADLINATELAAWAGSANITTLGTIATGVWEGTAVDGAYLTGSPTFTTVNLTTLDLGTNTITDGNLTGNWIVSGTLNVQGNKIWFGETAQTIQDQGDYISIWDQVSDYHKFYTAGGNAGDYHAIGTVQAEHLYSTDDLVVDGLATIGETLTMGGNILANDGGEQIGAAGTPFDLIYVDEVDLGTTVFTDGNVAGVMAVAANWTFDANILANDGAEQIGSSGTPFDLIFVDEVDLGTNVITDGNLTGSWTGIVNLTTSGDVTVGDDIFQGDGDVHYFGSDNDAQIYHSGSHLFLKNATGNFGMMFEATGYLTVFEGTAGNPRLRVYGYDTGTSTTKLIDVGVTTAGTGYVQAEEAISLYASDGFAMELQYPAGGNINMFGGAGAGENPYVYVYGDDGGAVKWLRLRADTDGTGRVQAEENITLVAGVDWYAQTGANSDMYFDAGDDFLWRDFDGGLAIRMTLDSATGDLNITGSLDVDTNLNVDGNAVIDGTLTLGEYIYHQGDVDTYLRFETDTATLSAGGQAILVLDDDAASYIDVDTGQSFEMRVNGTAGLTLDEFGDIYLSGLLVTENEGIELNADALSGPPIKVTSTDSGTSSVINTIWHYRYSTGTVAAGFGIGQRYYLESDGGNNYLAGRITIAWTDATSTAEDSKWTWYTRTAGAENEAMRLLDTGALEVDADSGLGAATVGKFDNYDDVALIRTLADRFTGPQWWKENAPLYEELGVLSRKEDGAGWMLNVQTTLQLFAGAHYQTADRVTVLEEENARLRKRLGVLEAA